MLGTARLAVGPDTGQPVSVLDSKVSNRHASIEQKERKGFHGDKECFEGSLHPHWLALCRAHSILIRAPESSVSIANRVRNRSLEVGICVHAEEIAGRHHS